MDELRTVSAYHNYLVEGMLQAELMVEAEGGFFFHAHRLTPGDQVPTISGCFFDRQGEFLLRIRRNVLVENPYGFSLLEMAGGWSLMSTDMEAILSAQVLSFSHGLLSVIRGALHDCRGQRLLFGDETGLHVTRRSGEPGGICSHGGLKVASGWR